MVGFANKLEKFFSYFFSRITYIEARQRRFNHWLRFMFYAEIRKSIPKFPLLPLISGVYVLHSSSYCNMSVEYNFC